jgi:prepilin-type N-terminal cleavage/methylation domain-containing protein
MYYKRNFGFTLLEILVVMGIIVILMSIVMTGISAMRASRIAPNGVAQVMDAIAKARAQAVYAKHPHGIRVENIGTDNQWVSVFTFEKLSDALRANTEKDVLTFKSSDGVARGWNPTPAKFNEYTNRLLSREKFPEGAMVCTEYDPKKLFSGSNLSPSSVTTNPGEFVPRITPYFRNYAPTEPRLLWFDENGWASANVTILLRDKTKLYIIQVFKDGTIKQEQLRHAGEMNNF